MNLLEFFRYLFNTDNYPARWFCGSWSSEIGWLTISSDLIIWLAYTSIPISLIYFIYNKPGAPFLRIFYLFGGFILSCGFTHLIESIIFWYPVYNLQAYLKLITAIISTITAIVLIKVIPKALNLKSAAELEKNLVENLKLNEELSLKSAEMSKKLTELEKLNDIHINRELNNLQMKKEINDLRLALNMEIKYHDV